MINNNDDAVLGGATAKWLRNQLQRIIVASPRCPLLFPCQVGKKGKRWQRNWKRQIHSGEERELNNWREGKELQILFCFAPAASSKLIRRWITSTAGNLQQFVYQERDFSDNIRWISSRTWSGFLQEQHDRRFWRLVNLIERLWPWVCQTWDVRIGIAAGWRIKPTAAVHQDANSTLIRSSNTIRLSQNITVYTCQAVILYEVKADLNLDTCAATWWMREAIFAEISSRNLSQIHTSSKLVTMEPVWWKMPILTKSKFPHSL